MRDAILCLSFVFLVLGCEEKDTVFSSQFEINDKGQILIPGSVPLLIKDSIIHFVWDTGIYPTLVTSSGNIDSKQASTANEIELQTIEKAFVERLGSDSFLDENTRQYSFAGVSDPTLLIAAKYPVKQNIVYIVPGDNHENTSYIGQSFFKDLFYALDFSTKTMKLSRKEISLDKYAIKDSLVLPYSIEDRQMVFRLKFVGDSVRLTLNTGHISFLKQAEQNSQFALDFVFFKTDMTNRLSSPLVKNSKRVFQQNKSSNLLCMNENVEMGSYKFDFVTPIMFVENYDSKTDGIITNAFLMRFNLVYNDTKKQLLKLYMLDGCKSILNHN
ncbi:MAG: hypothetical protein ACRDCN_14175 [Tannerellaceae bacterium]